MDNRPVPGKRQLLQMAHLITQTMACTELCESIQSCAHGRCKSGSGTLNTWDFVSSLPAPCWHDCMAGGVAVTSLLPDHWFESLMLCSPAGRGGPQGLSSTLQSLCITEYEYLLYGCNLPITACACRKQSLDRVRSIVEANPSTMDVSRASALLLMLPRCVNSV